MPLLVDFFEINALGFNGVAPRDERAQKLVPTRINSRRSVPISLSRIGNRNAVRTAPILANDAANPAPAPRIEIGNTSPAIR
jgi:hypothetical protein